MFLSLSIPVRYERRAGRNHVKLDVPSVRTDEAVLLQGVGWIGRGRGYSAPQQFYSEHERMSREPVTSGQSPQGVLAAL